MLTIAVWLYYVLLFMLQCLILETLDWWQTIMASQMVHNIVMFGHLYTGPSIERRKSSSFCCFDCKISNFLLQFCNLLIDHLFLGPTSKIGLKVPVSSPKYISILSWHSGGGGRVTSLHFWVYLASLIIKYKENW